MVYRTTLRCSDIYRTYLNELFQSTSLDRTQILRAALFTSASNPVFLNLMKQFQYRHQSDISPSPFDLWGVEDHYLWLEQDPIIKEREGCHDDVSERKVSSSNNVERVGSSGIKQSISTEKETAQYNRRKPQVTGPTRQISSIRSQHGGIKLDLR